MPSLLARFRPAPLSSGFFLASILGLLVTLFYFDAIAATSTGKSFALAFIILFVLMFIASIISMRRAPAGAQIALDHHMTKAAESGPAYRPVAQAIAKPSRRRRSRAAKQAKRTSMQANSRIRRRR